jgi:hypothetical protein
MHHCIDFYINKGFVFFAFAFLEIMKLVGLADAQAQFNRSGPFSTVFLPHSRAMGLQIRQKLSSPEAEFRFDAASPTGS